MFIVEQLARLEEIGIDDVTVFKDIVPAPSDALDHADG